MFLYFEDKPFLNNSVVLFFEQLKYFAQKTIMYYRTTGMVIVKEAPLEGALSQWISPLSFWVTRL